MAETFEISSRRYLGNKYKLTPFIRQVVEQNCPNVDSVFDAFAGTGSVAYAFRDKLLYVNDLMYSNYLASLAWFSPQEIRLDYLNALADLYNSVDVHGENNYMSDNFSNTYFSDIVCRRIGFIRDDIQDRYEGGVVNEREMAVIVTSLTYAMDRIASTCGHYDSFIQGADYNNEFVLRLPLLNYRPNPLNQCFNMDANQLVAQIHCDLMYLDPPYNSRQYCDAYHLLENIALWQKPEVEGVARKMDRTTMKSEYCRTTAGDMLADLVNRADCRFIALSYNNNGKKLQIRSNAKISDERIMDILSAKGEVHVFEQDFRPFSAGKGQNTGNKERLFLCVVRR
jgi:adenine-specific DNA-methyltransferase